MTPYRVGTDHHGNVLWSENWPGATQGLRDVRDATDEEAAIMDRIVLGTDALGDVERLRGILEGVRT